MLRRGLAVLVSLASIVIAGGPLGCDLFAPPETPAEAEPGSCCARGGRSRIVGADRSCCVGKLDRNQCDKGGGLWFHSPEGCRGGC